MLFLSWEDGFFMRVDSVLSSGRLHPD